VPPSILRWFQGVVYESKLLAWPSPISQRLGNHVVPHTGLRVVGFTKLQRSHTAAARHLACPTPEGLLQPSLPAPDRSEDRSVMTTGTFVSFLTGLSPAALSALWAAHETNPKQFLRSLFKCNGFAQSGWFFAGKTNPKLPAPLARTPGFLRRPCNGPRLCPARCGISRSASGPQAGLNISDAVIPAKLLRLVCDPAAVRARVQQRSAAESATPLSCGRRFSEGRGACGRAKAPSPLALCRRSP